MRALPIRQPHAEAIMRGVKPIEYRTWLTRVRGRIFIYAACGRYSKKEEARLMATYGMAAENCDDLPRGVLIGTVDLWECTPGDSERAWQFHVRNPERLKTLLRPTTRPNVKFFYPFGAKEQFS
jgi:hypothetical protein